MDNGTKRHRCSDVEPVESLGSDFRSTELLGNRSARPPWDALGKYLVACLGAVQEGNVGLSRMTVPCVSEKLVQLSGMHSRVTRKLEQLSWLDSHVSRKLEQLSGVEARLSANLEQLSGVDGRVSATLEKLS